jgi:hypothetical protein
MEFSGPRFEVIWGKYMQAIFALIDESGDRDD